MDDVGGPQFVSVELDAPPEVANWRPLVQWFLAIPHHVISGALNGVSEALWVVSFFTVLFTQRIPDGIANLQVMILRYRARVAMYAAFAHEQYPKFEFSMSGADPGGDPLRVSIERTTTWQRQNAFNVILAIPHFFVLFAYGVAAFVLLIVNLFGVLFTGKWNVGHRAFIVKVARYQTRVFSYVLMLRNEYPSFTLG